MKNSIKAIKQREKLHESFKGKHRSQKTKDKISKSNKGKPKTKEHIASIQQAKFLKTYPSKYKPIYQYDLKENFIKEWSSCVEVALFYNCKKGSVTEACSKNKKLKEFLWKYN